MKCIDADKIPQVKLDQLARALLIAAKKAFEDPQIAEEFKRWQEAKKISAEREKTSLS